MNSTTQTYSWQNCPEEIRRPVEGIVAAYQRVLENDLIGIYLHGSLAMGCYNPSMSDLDFLAVVHQSVSPEDKYTILELLDGLSSLRPEMSIVTLGSVRSAEYPPPYELHYSEAARSSVKADMLAGSLKQTDPDLPLHFEVIRRRGICLYGRPIPEVFPATSRNVFCRSLHKEITWIADNITTVPWIYAILNPCRALAYLEENVILSKQEAGKWGLEHLPAHYSGLITDALAQYSGREEQEPPAQTEIDSFFAFVQNQIDRSQQSG